MMQFESIKTPTDLENYPLGTVVGGSLETYVRTANSWCSCTLEEFYSSEQLFGFLPVGMMSGDRRVGVYYVPEK